MICAIEHKIENYIEGIFSSIEKSNQYFSNLKEKENFTIVETKLNYYPIYILEGLPDKLFTYTDKQEEVIKWLHFFDKNRNNDNKIYFNIYYILEDIFNKGMGAWNHQHIRNEYLDALTNQQHWNNFSDFFGHFDHIIRQLYAEKDNIKQQLKNDIADKTFFIHKKIECEKALQWLILAQKNHINPQNIKNIFYLPYTNCGYSEYRVMNDCETDDKNMWIEAMHQKKPIRLNGGECIIQFKE